MKHRFHFLRVSAVYSAVLLCAFLLLPPSAPAADGGRQIVSGPVSFSLKAGGENNSEMLGIDGRVDYLTRLINLHLFGTYEALNAGRGIGGTDNRRIGAGFALSHTYPGKANAFVGTSFIRESAENYGHAYVGGKVKVTDYALLAATYGFGFGPIKEVGKLTSKFFATESVDWLKAGVVLVNKDGWKLNAYYTLTDIKDKKLSGAEGEISYPVFDHLTVGMNGACDLTKKDDVERNWRGSLFVTYAYGTQKGNPIDVALEKNSPVEYPRIVRRKASGGGTVSISPVSASAFGCSTDTVTFTASGGVPPYTWSSNDSSNLTVDSATQASWFDGSDNYCGSSGTPNPVTVTVTDSVGNSATATIDVQFGV